MSNKKIGLQLCTVGGFLKTPDEISNTFKKIKQAGYDTIQLIDLSVLNSSDLKNILDETGILACSIHTRYEKLCGNTDKVLQDAKIIGYKSIVCPVLEPKVHNNDINNIIKAVKDLNNIGKILHDNGITLSYHNHGMEFQQYGKKLMLEIIYEESDPNYLQAEIDTYWVQYGGGDPAQWILKYKNRQPSVHLKDMTIEQNKQVITEVGNGNLNWDSIFKALEQAGTEWYIVEQEHTYVKDPFDCIKISRDNLRKMGY